MTPVRHTLTRQGYRAFLAPSYGNLITNMYLLLARIPMLGLRMPLYLTLYRPYCPCY